MKKILSLFFVFSIFSISGHSQDALGSFLFNGGLPVGAFQSESGNQFFPSLSVGFLQQLGRSPVYLGGEFGYMLYGTAMHRSNNVINGTEQGFRIRRNNNAIHLAGVVRVMPDIGIGIRPFVEGQLGAIHTYTRSKVRENRLTEPMASGTEVYDWSHLYQLGGGLMIPLEKGGDTFLELRVNYMQTGTMDFLNSRDASYDNQGAVTLNTRNAAFQLLTPSVAVKFRF
jgi:hypothetical protein